MNQRQAFDLLIANVQPVIPVTTPPIAIGLGWPSETTLQSVATGKNGSANAIVSVFDNGPSLDTTRWPVTQEVVTLIPTNLVSTLSLPDLPGGGVATLTLTGAVQVNDAVSLFAQLSSISTEGQVVVAGQTDTLNTLASSLANAINGDSTLSQWMHATVSGAVITLHSLITSQVLLASLTCNNASAIVEQGRELRQVILTVWANNAALRDAVAIPIRTLLRKTASAFGFYSSPLNEYLRIMKSTTQYVDDPILQNLYREDIRFGMEYGITTTDLLYPVLVAQAGLQVLTN